MLLRELLPDVDSFRFNVRPVPVPGDLRRNWRISLVVLILAHSRGGKASLPKVHLVSDVLRTKRNMDTFGAVLSQELSFKTWNLRVEPALGRALDFAVGQGLIVRNFGGSVPSYSLTEAGRNLAERLLEDESIFETEKAFLGIWKRTITEGLVQDIVKMRAS